MRRLMVLAGMLLLAIVAVGFAAGGQTAGDGATIRLRDGAALALIAASLAAWVSAPYPYTWNQTTWSTIARALVGSGMVTAIVALGLRFVPVAALPNLSEIVWMVGMIAAFAGIALPAVIVRFAPPAYTWKKTPQGAPVRTALNPHGDPLGALHIGRGWWASLAAIIVLGTAVRLWQVSQMPPVCLSTGTTGECAALLLLAPDAAALAPQSALLIPLARILMAVNGWLGSVSAEPLWALRWASATVAILTLPALAIALRPLSGPAGILLGAALFAVHPLFVGLAVNASVESVLWLLLATAGGGSALRSQNPRAWVLTGLALGLLMLTQPRWAAAWLLWLAVCALLIAVRRPLRASLAPISLLFASAPAGAALSSVTVADVIAPIAGNDTAAGNDIVQPLARIAEWLATAQAGSIWVLALAVVGGGSATRLGRPGILLLAGSIATFVVAARVQEGDPQALLVFAALFAAVALDQLVRAAQRVWTPLIRPANWLVLGTAIVLGLSGWNLYEQSRTQVGYAIPADDQAALATIEFIQTARDDPALADATWLLSPTLFAHGAIRSATEAERSAGRLLPFAGVADLPFAGEALGGLVYLLPASDLLTLETLRAVYPEGRALPLADAESADAIQGWRVDPAVLFDSTGLVQFVYEGSEFGSADEAALSLGVGPLTFAWGIDPPNVEPFSVEWSGSLLARTLGEYQFFVDAPQDSTFSMTLDDRLILDTSLGLTARSESLPEGAHRLEMRYRSGDIPGNLTILWQPPGEEPAPIPRESLYNPAIPDMGLLGTYSAGSAWDGVLITQRKDLQIIPDGTLELPWGVVWQGHLAAPRTGEYLIGTVTNGALLLDIAGKRLITRMPDALEIVAPPTEGTIYLEQGWTPVTIRFAPNASRAQTLPELRLYWQPPGSEPGPLRSTYLTSAAEGEVTRPLPALSALDARLGDDAFALSADNSLWMPQVTIPPANLTLLPFENETRWGVCGAGEGQLAAPHGIVWDAATDTIYVADTGNARIVALDPATGTSAILPIADLEEPVDVALTPEGEVLVLDTAAPKLARYDPVSESVQIIPLTEGFYRPRAIAIDRAGITYIADTGGARIAVVTPEGGMLTAFGGAETRIGTGQPAAVGVTARALWAVTAEDGRLWQLNTLGSLTAIQPTDTINGPHIATFAPLGAGATPDSAAAIAASSAGDDTLSRTLFRTLFVSDPARRMISWFAESGQPLGALADEGAFDQPTGIAVIQRGEETLLAVMDTVRCELSTWRAVAANLLEFLPQ